MRFEIRNVNSDHRWKKPKDGIHDSWIEYWSDNNTKDIPETCPCCGKKMSDHGGKVGGHVRKTSDPHGIVFITPICDECNKTYKESKAYEKYFFVDEKMLVPANYRRLEMSSDNMDLEEDLDEDGELDDKDWEIFSYFGLKKEDIDKGK